MPVCIHTHKNLPRFPATWSTSSFEDHPYSSTCQECMPPVHQSRISACVFFHVYVCQYTRVDHLQIVFSENFITNASGTCSCAQIACIYVLMSWEIFTQEYARNNEEKEAHVWVRAKKIGRDSTQLSGYVCTHIIHMHNFTPRLKSKEMERMPEPKSLTSSSVFQYLHRHVHVMNYSQTE